MNYMQIICLIAIVGSLIIGLACKDRGITLGSIIMLAVVVFGMWASGLYF